MATPDEILKSYESAVEKTLSHIGDSRAGQTFLGGAKNSLASDVNAGAAIYDLTQGGRDTMFSEYQSAYEDGLNHARRDLAQLRAIRASAQDIAGQQAIVDDYRRKLDAMSRAGEAQRGATQATYRLADDIKDSAAASVAKAKDGISAVGKTAVDVGVALTEIGLDKAKSALLIGGLGPNYISDDMLKKLADNLKLAPLAARSFGNNSQSARQDGANLTDATLYGILTAVTDTVIEDTLDGLAGVYGVGRWDAEIKGAFKRYAKSKTGKRLLGVAASVTGEWFESFVSSVVKQMLKSVYTGKDSIQSISETEWDKALHNAVVGGVLGIPHGAVSEFSKSQ